MAANEERNETLAIKTTPNVQGTGTQPPEGKRRSRAFFSRRDSALERFQAAVASAAASVSHSFNHPGLSALEQGFQEKKSQSQNSIQHFEYSRIF